MTRSEATHTPCVALVVFAKSPVAGQVKTRLTPPLSGAEAAALYTAFLGDALEQYANLGREVSVAVRLYLAGDRVPALASIPRSISLHRQRGRALGERMLTAFVESFRAGFERIVVIGTDHPTLPSAFVERAFQHLAEPMTVVIGPSTDGGYYLLGMNELYARLFEMAFSHGEVFAETLRRASVEAEGVVVLPEWYDVDDQETLLRLIEEWRDGVPVPPRTTRALEALLVSHPNLA